MKVLDRYSLALCLLAASLCTTPVFAEGEEEAVVPVDHVTEKDRVWWNFNRETAVVGSGKLRLAVRASMINKAVKDDEPDLTGFPLVDFERAIDIANGNTDVCPPGPDEEPPTDPRCAKVESVEGFRFDLRGAYGLGSTAEVGFNMPFFSESIKFEDREPATMNEEDVGDLQLYAKFRRTVANNLTMGGGLELSIPTGSERKRMGTGELAFNPFANIRYQNGRIALGGHVGFNMYEGDQADVLNYSTYVIARATENLAFRVEFNGRFFRDFGTDYNDLSVWPGFDWRMGETIVLRPQANVGITGDAWDWGIGAALVWEAL